jgi:hypothetical protein
VRSAERTGIADLPSNSPREGIVTDDPLGVADPFLAETIAAAERDPETVGLLLHGSRAGGEPRDDSDYDLIRVVTQEAYDSRPRSQLHKRIEVAGGPSADVLYQTISRIAGYVTEPGWYTATYLSARVLFDRTGELSAILSRMRSESGRVARENTASAYDGYLNSFVRSIKAARHGDDLGRRLHAAESSLALVRALFGLESIWPPYHDALAGPLAEVEQAQGWPSGYLGTALIRLVSDGDPSFQQQLEERVEQLMASRGVLHEWGTDLEPLKALQFEASR